MSQLYKYWGVNGNKLNAILPRYLHLMFFGIQIWHLPSLPYIYSSLFTYLRHTCKEQIKFVQIHFFVQCGIKMGHFRPPPCLCLKTRVGAHKSFFILSSTRKVVHLASFWKWGFLELGSDLFTICTPKPGDQHPNLFLIGVYLASAGKIALKRQKGEVWQLWLTSGM